MDNELHPNFTEGNVSLDKETREFIYFQLYARKEMSKGALVQYAEDKELKISDKIEALLDTTDKIRGMEQAMKRLIG
ncbi:hypothetical protein [Bacillus thuringiensis]|uniref:hypothetical protein n=1 Tax=Bacillus thuringiensis TaxID=1428 RepID=UPI000BF43071|nr:hypothetical protein [Bacillus thuringiensis]PEV64110.1 hypothetical protein CN434_25215 [Bacillus thuringiensis]